MARSSAYVATVFILFIALQIYISFIGSLNRRLFVALVVYPLTLHSPLLCRGFSHSVGGS